MQDGEPNQTYNISANQELSNIEVFQRVCNTLGRGHELVKHIDDRPGHDFRYSSKLRKIGWEPQFKFSDGIIDCCQWYINNQFFLQI